jgi:hypothetical protein
MPHASLVTKGKRNLPRADPHDECAYFYVHRGTFFFLSSKKKIWEVGLGVVGDWFFFIFIFLLKILDLGECFGYFLKMLLAMMTDICSIQYNDIWYAFLRRRIKLLYAWCVGMKTDRIRTNITDIVFVFIFISGFGFEYG